MKQSLLQIVLMKASLVRMVLVPLLAAPHLLACLWEVSPSQMWEVLVEKVRTPSYQSLFATKTRDFAQPFVKDWERCLFRTPVVGICPQSIKGF